MELRWRWCSRRSTVVQKNERTTIIYQEVGDRVRKEGRSVPDNLEIVHSGSVEWGGVIALVLDLNSKKLISKLFII